MRLHARLRYTPRAGIDCPVRDPAKSRCGQAKDWLWPVFMDPEDYYTFYEPPPPPHPPHKNYPYLEAVPYVPGFDVVDGQYIKVEAP